MSDTTPTPVSFNVSIPTLLGSQVELPVSTSAPLFVVGPNGSGKSGLMQLLFSQNAQSAVRIAAHRRNWMDSNFVPFAPNQKMTQLENVRTQDMQAHARYKEWNADVRTGLVISDIIDAHNSMAREVLALTQRGDIEAASQLALTPAPLDTVGSIFNIAGMPIEFRISTNSAIVARKEGGLEYSIAALSDGERAAFLLLGRVLTANEGSLILIDEPERHLHGSIIGPLLTQMFAERADCTFVVSTHELSLPLNYRRGNSVLVRGCETNGESVSGWDIEVLRGEVQLDDSTKQAILGSRRTMLFVEGSVESLDKPLYELLFPGVAIHPRSTCGEVQRAVASISASQELVWLRALGIIDQDGLSPERKLELEARSVYPLSTYSVEGLYYNTTVIRALALRVDRVVGSGLDGMVSAAFSGALSAVAEHSKRLAARMTEQTVKDEVSLHMLDWKKIHDGENVDIQVDAQKRYAQEIARLGAWIESGDLDAIMGRYPLRETPALHAIAMALEFRSRKLYEDSVRKMVREDNSIRDHLLKCFGRMPAAIQ